MSSYITGMTLSSLTKLTVTPWYHQITQFLQKFPNCLTSLSLYCWLVWFRVHTPHLVLCFLKTVFQSRPSLPVWRNEVHCHPLGRMSSVLNLHICCLWSPLICSCIPYISGKVEASSWSLFAMGSDIWVRVHRMSWDLLLHHFRGHIVGLLSTKQDQWHQVMSADLCIDHSLPSSPQPFT